MEMEEKSPEKIRREINIVEQELENLSNFQWSYAKQMLKFGSAAWVFGLSTFVSTLLIYQGPRLIFSVPPLSISLLIGAAAAPIVITVTLLQRQHRKLRRLERIRQDLLSSYKKVLLKRVKKTILER